MTVAGNSAAEVPPAGQSAPADQSATPPVAGADLQSQIPVVQIKVPGDSAAVVDTTIEQKPPDVMPMLEKYKDREWFKNMAKSENPDKLSLLVDQFENTQKLVGQKASVQFPTDKSTPEELASFRKMAGIPDTSDGYTLKPGNFAPEDKSIIDYLNNAHNDGMVKRMQVSALKNNLTPAQFQAVHDDYTQAFIAEYKQGIADLQKANADLDIDFDKQMVSTFGGRSEQVKANCRQIMQNCLPADSPFRPAMEKQSNETFLLLAAILDGVNQKYIKEDKFTGGNFTGAAGMTAIEHRAKGMALMANEAYTNPRHAQHEYQKALVAEHYRNVPKERLM